MPFAPSQAFMLPLFLPVLMSLLDAQQQHMLSCMIQAKTAVPAAIHIKANISIPIDAPMLSSVADVIAFSIMINYTGIRLASARVSGIGQLTMTVAAIVATVVNNAARNVRSMIGSDAHRV